LLPWADEASFTSFYERTARPLWAYVYRTVGNGADADEIVQDAFCRIATADVAALDDEERRRYLFRIAGNLITDRWRRSSREQAWIASAQREQPSSEVPPEPLGVEQLFQRLKPRERAMLWLAYVEGQSHETIAASLNVGKGSVKVLLSRARARLRDLLASGGIMGERDG
jgi:RNA polymerase sigma-70 factor, ECF subfamily